MVKFKKLFNLKVISLIVACVFLCNTTLYSYPISRNSLRIPSGEEDNTYKRIKKATESVIQPESNSRLPEDINSSEEKQFQSLYLDSEGKDLKKIEDVKSQIGRINLGEYKKIKELIKKDRFDKIDEDLLKEIFPFFESLNMDDHGTTSFGHTMEVFDAFVRIMAFDEAGYNQKRQETFEADNHMDEAEGDKLSKLQEVLQHIQWDLIVLGKNERLKAVITRISKKFEGDPSFKQLFFLLPLLHDVGKLVKFSGHAEIGARYFVRPILEKLGFNDDVIKYAETVIEKHVDISTVITTERTPEYLKEGLEGKNSQDMMDALTILSIADRSYGDRAHRMTSKEFGSYLEWGDLKSDKWKSEDHRWHLARIARYLGLSSLYEAEEKIRSFVAPQDAELIKEYIGKKIKVFDYADAVFNHIVKNDPTGEVLIKLLVILAKMAKKYGDDIFRINLFKKPPSSLEVLYRVAKKVNVTLTADKIETNLNDLGVVFTANMGRFLNVKIDESVANRARARLATLVDVNVETGNVIKSIKSIKAVVFDWDDTVMRERKTLFKHQIKIILEIWYGNSNYKENSAEWKEAEAFYKSTLGMGAENRFQSAIDKASQGNKSGATPKELVKRLKDNIQDEMESELPGLRSDLDNELIPGVLELLKQLKELKVPMYIVSANSWLYPTNAVEKLGLGEYFDGVYGVGSPEYLDTIDKEEVLKRICKENQCESSNVLMIGDTQKDLEAAKEVGLKFLAVVHDATGSDYFRDKKADAILPVNDRFNKVRIAEGLPEADVQYKYVLMEKNKEEVRENGEKYSSFKLGDPGIVEEYADIITPMIEERWGDEINSNPGAWRVVLHIVQGGNNASGILSKKVAKKLGIETSVVETPDPNLGSKGAKGYAAISSKEVREEVIRGKHRVARLDEVKHKNIIFIDDSVVSGSNLNEMRRIHHKAGVASFQAFVLYKLEGTDFSFEKRFNQMGRDTADVVETLKQLLNDERFIYINSCTRYIFNTLNDGQLDDLLESVNERVLLNLYIYGVRRRFEKVVTVAQKLNKKIAGQGKFPVFDPADQINQEIFDHYFDTLMRENDYDILWEKVDEIVSGVRTKLLAYYFKLSQSQNDSLTEQLVKEALRAEGIEVDDTMARVVTQVVQRLFNEPLVLSKTLAADLKVKKKVLKEAYSILQRSKTIQSLFLNESDHAREITLMRGLLMEGDFWNKLFNGETPYPLLVEFHLALKCNKHCPYCWSLGKSYSPEGVPLSEKEIKGLIDEFADNGVETIAINGGKEPLMTPLSLKAIEFAKQKGLYVMLVSNGVLLNEKNRQALINSGIDQIRVSLDAIDSARYADIYNAKPGECIRVKENLVQLTQLNRTQPNHKKTRIGVGVVVDRKNYDHILEMCEFANRIGLDFIDIRGVTEGKTEKFFTDEELEIIMRQGQEAQESFGGNLQIDFREESFKGVFAKGATRCWKGSREAPINPYGVIFDCALVSNPNFGKKHRMGNIRDNATFIKTLEDTREHRDNFDPKVCKECHYGDALLNIAAEKFRQDKIYGISLDEQPFINSNENTAYLLSLPEKSQRKMNRGI